MSGPEALGRCYKKVLVDSFWFQSVSETKHFVSSFSLVLWDNQCSDQERDGRTVQSSDHDKKREREGISEELKLVAKQCRCPQWNHWNQCTGKKAINEM